MQTRVTPFNPMIGNRFFGGESAQEKEVNNQLKAQKDFQNQVKGGDYEVYNRFNNYKDPFDYNTISNNLNEIFGETEKKINRNTADQIATEQGNAVSRFASRGVTGGSVMEDNANNIATNMNTGKINALADLGIGKASSMDELMKYFNQLNFAKTQAATGVDAGNKRNALSSLLQSSGLQGRLVAGLDDSTGWDDAFSALQTGAQIASAAATLSDRHFKENITRVGEKEGIPIYEFNYIGSPVRLRGVMADEVPQESVIKVGAISFVDYSKLPVDMEEV